MRLLILAVGDDLPGWAEAAVADYAGRSRPPFRPIVVPVHSPRIGSSMDMDRRRRLEAEGLRKVTQPGAWRVALDERGAAWSSLDLARRLGRWAESGRTVCLWIGGADGLDPALLADADELWSLSAMTLPHALARVVVVEQLYRAWTILQGHPYHRG